VPDTEALNDVRNGRPVAGRPAHGNEEETMRRIVALVTVMVVVSMSVVLGGSALLGVGRAADKGVVVVQVGGGVWADASLQAYVGPFEKETGIKVVAVRDWLSLAKLKLMVESQKVELDVGNMPWSNMIAATKAGYLERINYSVYNKAELAQMDDFSKQTHGIGNVYYSWVMGYSTEDFPPGKARPTTWAEFWDVKRFPGSRTLRAGNAGSGPYEEALLADGVPMDKLYPLDVERAFRSLSRIKPHITTWWKEGAEGQQLFADKVVVLGQVFHGRILDLRRKGVPVDIEWNQGKLSLDHWVIPKGAPNPENAQRFVEFATRARQQAAFNEGFPNGPPNRGAFEFIKPETARTLPTYPENRKKQLVLNHPWYAETGPGGKTNIELLIERWNKWILE